MCWIITDNILNSPTKLYGPDLLYKMLPIITDSDMLELTAEADQNCNYN